MRHGRCHDCGLFPRYGSTIATPHGLSPTWMVLEAAKPAHGRMLNYAQYVQPDKELSVSFASMAFYR